MNRNELGGQRCAEHAADRHSDLDRADGQRAELARRELRDERGRRRQRPAETDASDEAPHCQRRDARCRRGEQRRGAEQRRAQDQHVAAAPTIAEDAEAGGADCHADEGRRERWSECRSLDAQIGDECGRGEARCLDVEAVEDQRRRGAEQDDQRRPRSFADSRSRSTSGVCHADPYAASSGAVTSEMSHSLPAYPSCHFAFGRAYWWYGDIGQL